MLEISCSVLGQISGQFKNPKKKIDGLFKTLSALKEVMNLIADGSVTPVTDKVFSLDNISDAHKYIEDSNQFGKVILVP